MAAGRDLPVPPHGAPGPFGSADAPRNRAVLEGAGFVDVTHVELHEPFAAGDTPDDAFEFVSSSSLGRGLLSGVDPDTHERGHGRCAR